MIIIFYILSPALSIKINGSVMNIADSAYDATFIIKFKFIH